MRRHTGWVIGLVVVGMLGGLGSATRGHTPIASRFTYNEHVFPIFQRQCGSCHVEGGVGPMSLLTYRDAYPWAQSIREEVLGLRMPPWKAEDGFGRFRNGHVLPAHEMDIILEWSAGGYPQGPRDQSPPAPEAPTGWTVGEPSVELTLPEPFELDAGTSEQIRYFVLPTSFDTDRLVTGVDVLPGSRAVVRHVSVYVDTTGVARTADQSDEGPGFSTGVENAQPIAVWWPGQEVIDLEGVGYHLPAGADLVARILYKKTWITEGQGFTDQTRLGLHLADNGSEATSIDQTVLSSEPEFSGRQVTISHALNAEITMLGLLPEVAIESQELQVEGIRPDGTREPLLLIRDPDPGWPTRYWLDTPITMPSGSRIEVTARLRPGADLENVPSLFNSNAPVRVLLDHTTTAPSAD